MQGTKPSTAAQRGAPATTAPPPGVAADAGGGGVGAPAGVRRVNAVVGVILAIFAHLYLTTVRGVLAPVHGTSPRGWAHALALTANTAGAVYTYLQCVFGDPGRVPPGYAPDAEACGPLAEVKRKGGGARFCGKCRAHKPPRAHHCRTCRRCVTRMDHHCKYTNNCVGAGNLRAFLLFLVYINTAMFHAWLLIAGHAWASWRGLGSGTPGLATGTWLVVQTLTAILATPLAAALVSLAAWNVRLLWVNQTTIEHLEGVTARVAPGARLRRAGAGAGTTAGPAHPYDLGPVANLVSVCGPRPGEWLLPGPARAGVACGSGVSFGTAYDDEGRGGGGLQGVGDVVTALLGVGVAQALGLGGAGGAGDDRNR